MTQQTKIIVWLATSAAAIGSAFATRPIPQDPSYHHFADHARWLGLPNGADVLSNVAFCVVGAVGLWRLLRQPRFRGRLERELSAWVLFAGIFLTGIGSGFYHLAPDNVRLVWDRLPMTVVFASVLSLAVSHHIDSRLGCHLELPLVGCGVASVCYWHWTESLGRGDLRPYAVAQFYPPLGVLLLWLLFPRDLGSAANWAAAAGWYTLAKLMEWQDVTILSWTGCVSGHTLKHLAAALACYFIYRAWKREASRRAGASFRPT
jgi:hypothetical protein